MKQDKIEKPLGIVNKIKGFIEMMKKHFSGGIILAYLSITAFIPIRDNSDELRFVMSLIFGIGAIFYFSILKKRDFGRTLNSVLSFFVWVVSMGHWDFLLFEQWLGTTYSWLRGFVVLGYVVLLFLSWIRS